MTSVSVIGLGAMGSAIAQAFVKAGHPITVWNRNPARMQALAEQGIACASNVAECVEASPLVVICVSDYEASNSLLRTPAVEALVRGRTLVQFTTGKPQEARDAEQWAISHDGDYLDGAILAYPREVGRAALIILSGKSEVYSGTRNLLAALTSDLRYLGSAIGASAGLDIAILFYYICAHLGLTQAALICESEGVRPDLLATVIVDSSASDILEVRHLGDAIQNNEFSKPGASLGVYSAILDRVLSQAQDANINDEIPQFANAIVKRGMNAGYADQEIVSLIKLLRRSGTA
ncbi:MAG TPA: NAD(P)-binding domain-containing protein [Woeseiaceae bacterium]